MRRKEQYEQQGYEAQSWYLAVCPYADGTWQRDAWQRGCWRWQSEQRAAKMVSL